MVRTLSTSTCTVQLYCAVYCGAWYDGITVPYGGESRRLLLVWLLFLFTSIDTLGVYSRIWRDGDFWYSNWHEDFQTKLAESQTTFGSMEISARD